MKRLERTDLLDIASYETVRDGRLAEVIELKKRRRLAVGDLVTLVFENRSTVRSQVQEMMRAERTVEERAIQEELDVYNELIPEAGELSATLFIEVADQTRVREVLDRLIGLDAGGLVMLSFEGQGSAQAIFEGGNSRDDRISAVHYLRFPLGASERAAFSTDQGKIELVIRHPGYEACAAIDGTIRRALAEDLA